MKCTANKYFHIIPVKHISTFAQHHNSNNISNEFWEDFGDILYAAPIFKWSRVKDINIFDDIYKIFKDLDSNNLKYCTHSKVSDFVEKHIITNGRDKIMLCNKHLLKHFPKKNNGAQIFYTKDKWKKDLLKILFNKVDIVKGIPTDTPTWAINLIRSQPNSSKKRMIKRYGRKIAM